MKSTSPREIPLSLDSSGGPDDCGAPAVPGEACLLSCLRGRGFKGRRVSIQRHIMFGKEEAGKMGGGLAPQTGNGLRDRWIRNSEGILFRKSPLAPLCQRGAIPWRLIIRNLPWQTLSRRLPLTLLPFPHHSSSGSRQP